MKKMLNIVLFSAITLLLTIFISNKAYAVETVRLAGADRYATSLQVSKSNWQTSNYVFIASGKDFPDALCATPLAKKYNAPIILIDGDTLSNDTINEYKRLAVKTVYIIGGTGVISKSVEDTTKSLGINVIRLGGKDRYETSLLVAKELGTSTKVALVTGDTFPDAISVATPAALEGMPILLTSKDTIDARIKQFITSVKRDKVYGIGGTGVISNAVLSQFSNTKRLSGLDRIDTNLAVVNEFLPDLNFSSMFVASALDFPDGLTGSAAAALSSSPVFLLDKNNLAKSISFISSKVDTNASFKILGGTGVIDSKVEQQLQSLKNKTVVIDPGHGGYDVGAVGPTGVNEKDVNLAVALKLGTLLQSQGINVVYTRVDDNVSWTNDIHNDLQTRCDIANKVNADFFISIHSNSSDSSSAIGTETYYTTKKPSDSSLAKTMQDNLVAVNNLYDRGVKSANFYVLNNTNMPSVLVELAFISNPNEEKLLNSADFQTKSANGLSKGIMTVLGL